MREGNITHPKIVFLLVIFAVQPSHFFLDLSQIFQIIIVIIVALSSDTEKE